MDRIFLEDVRFWIAVGVTEAERIRPQPCRLDVVLEADLSQAGETGDLSRGVDYAAVFATLEQICGRGSFQLLEEIAHQACQAILGQFPVESVQFAIRKLRPFTDQIGAVGIEVRRRLEP